MNTQELFMNYRRFSGLLVTAGVLVPLPYCLAAWSRP
jgi:hypothetical protein